MVAIAGYHRWTHHFHPGACQPRRADHTVVQKVRETADGFAALADDQLIGQAAEIRRYLASGVELLHPDMLVPAFALMLESVRRCTGMVYYDVQLLAGLALATGAVAEMKTGEGKTIVAGLPACLYGMSGKGAHVATVNRYLAQRDWEQMRRPLEMLGLTVGLSRENTSAAEKRLAYACDITYSTGYELGFDFLRDQVALRSQPALVPGQTLRNQLRGVPDEQTRRIQRGHHFAIIDEVDSVLVDEANTPLILSQSSSVDAETTAIWEHAHRLAAELLPDQDYQVELRKRSLRLTTQGQRKVYDQSDVPSSGLYRPWSVYVEQTLRARHLLRRDVDYVIRDGRILLVDPSTGRIFSDRNWRDGLHQAVEFKEGVEVTGEKQSVARVSRQRYFGMYATLAGMSGTCTGQESEFFEFYRLPVVVIPERVPNQREHLATRYFSSRECKWKAITQAVDARFQTGQPILVGTATIEESRQLANRFTQNGIPHQVLNGQQDEEEAEIIATAGRVGSVLIATNMAGRGTDISVSSDALALGGLHVIVSGRQSSARVDRQLIGRCARQGDEGSCQFFISAQDELLTRFAPEFARQLADACQNQDSEGNPSTAFDTEVDRAQHRAERQHYLARSSLFRQDQWLNEVLDTVAEEPSGK